MQPPETWYAMHAQDGETIVRARRISETSLSLQIASGAVSIVAAVDRQSLLAILCNEPASPPSEEAA